MNEALSPRRSLRDKRERIPAMISIRKWLPLFSLMLLLPLLCALAACNAKQSGVSDPGFSDLDRRYERIRSRSEAYGEGGQLVLEIAYKALLEGKAEGKWADVGIEDLWAHAIKEGAGLFNDPSRRWGKTTAEETKDLIGQTTIGPWQITINNVKNIYGKPYGIAEDWPDEKVYAFCRDHPDVQVKMIADYIHLSYSTFGRRTPYAIQRYFWLDGYVRGWIGRGEWDKSVLCEPPDGNWRNITPEMKANTGFYAKQLVCGWRSNSHGLLYWLWVTRDDAAMRDLLRAWRDQPRLAWDEAQQRIVPTVEPGGFAIKPEDFKYMASEPEAQAALSALAAEILAEQPK